jgi:hypothetical protein
MAMIVGDGISQEKFAELNSGQIYRFPASVSLLALQIIALASVTRQPRLIENLELQI